MTDPTPLVGTNSGQAGGVREGPTHFKDIGFLWKSLVVGLLVVLVADLGAIIYAHVADKESTALVGIFTTVLSGLLGLFITTPGRV